MFRSGVLDLGVAWVRKLWRTLSCIHSNRLYLLLPCEGVCLCVLCVYIYMYVCMYVCVCDR